MEWPRPWLKCYLTLDTNRLIQDLNIYRFGYQLINGLVFQGKFTGLSPIFHGKITLVSAVDFPLNQATYGAHGAHGAAGGRSLSLEVDHDAAP